MNEEHVYAWMVHDYSRGRETMKGEILSVAFSGTINHVFNSDSNTPISGPPDARWLLLAVAKFDKEWKFNRVHKLMPLAETGPTCDLNVAAILPHIRRS
jgi:hypothetical protein